MKYRPIRVLTKNREGATAIESAIIALPFFLLFMGIIEIGLTIFADSSLNSAVRTVARQGVASGYTNFNQIEPIMQGHMAGVYRDVANDSEEMKFRMVVLNNITDAAQYKNNPELVFSKPSGLPPIASQKGALVIYAAKYKWDGFTNLLAPVIPGHLYSITVVKNEAF